MLRFVLLFSLILCPLAICKRKHNDEKESSASGDLSEKSETDLRKKTNKGLSSDEEYEDLQAELFAYQAALASLNVGRRSLKTTPCWKMGGICIDHKMCQGHHSLSQVAGCRDKLQVCCFTWNNFQVRDMSDKGIGLAMPWSSPQKEFGGLGVIDPPSAENKKPKIHKKLSAIENDDFIPLEHEKSSMLVILRHKKET